MRKTAVVVFAQKVYINKASKAAYQRIILKECCLIPHKNFVSVTQYQIAKSFCSLEILLQIMVLKDNLYSYSMLSHYQNKNICRAQVSTYKTCLFNERMAVNILKNFTLQVRYFTIFVTEYVLWVSRIFQYKNCWKFNISKYVYVCQTLCV